MSPSEELIRWNLDGAPLSLAAFTPIGNDFDDGRPGIIGIMIDRTGEVACGLGEGSVCHEASF